MFNIDNIIYEDRNIEKFNSDIFNNIFSEFHSLNNIDSSYNFNNNDNISLDENNYFFKEENLQPINLDKTIIIGEQSTNIKTKNEKIFPDFFSFDESINKWILLFEIFKKKKKGENYFNLIIEKEKNSDKKKRGRKASVNPSIIHNNMSEDNIIKKIKAKLFNYIIIFFNRILQKININDIKLLKLDYKYINNLSKIFELQLFTNKLKYLLSFEVLLFNITFFSIDIKWKQMILL